MYKLLHSLHTNANEVNWIGKAKGETNIEIIQGRDQLGSRRALECRGKHISFLFNYISITKGGNNSLYLRISKVSKYQNLTKN